MSVEPRMTYNHVENAMEIWNLRVYFVHLFKEFNSLVITDLLLHARHDLYAKFVLLPLFWRFFKIISHHLREPASCYSDFYCFYVTLIVRLLVSWKSVHF